MAREASLKETTDAGAHAGDLLSAAVQSIPMLIADRRESPELQRFRALSGDLPAADTRTLILRLQTMTDPLLLWGAHLVLDARDVPPSLRWPANDQDQQAEFITWCADLYWLCRRQPQHRPRFRGWNGLFKHKPGSEPWHATAHRQFLFVAARYSLSHWCSKGLDLSDIQRAMLMTMPTNRMQADRRALDPARFAELHRLLLQHAACRPDKSGRHQPHDLAARRAAMWRTYILAGRNQTAAAAHWFTLTGEAVSRQAFAKQTAIAADVMRLAARGLI